MLNLKQMTVKLNKWAVNFDKYTSRGIKDMVKKLEGEVKAAYSGGKVKMDSGRTFRSIKSKFSKGGLVAKVFFSKLRSFVAAFHESGTRKMRATPVMGPLRKKYTGKIGKNILKELMRGYKKSG